VAFGEGGNIAKKRDQSVVWALDVLEACEGLGEIICHDRPFQCIISLSPADDALCLGMSSGHIVTIEMGSDVNPLSVEEVGEIEGGISAMAWSPDGEMVALVGGYGQCLLMSSSWDVLMETHVFRVDCTNPQPTAAPEVDAIEVCDLEDPKAWFVMHGALSQGDASISWRGDCKYFTTVARRSPDSPGRVRIWDVEGQDLHALGEQSPGTLAVLAWQPQGRVLCVANFLGVGQEEEVHLLRQMTREEGDQGQAPEVRHVGAWKRELKRRQEAVKRLGSDSWGPNRVFLYERNGLQHGEFIIPGSSSTVIEHMEWSTDSQTLAIVLREKDEDHMSVQVWCRSNWKWYNKFTRRFRSVDDIHITWQDTQNGTYLCMLTSHGLLSKVCLSWGYTSSSYGTIAVVDGGSLMITPMRRCMIPPPMCAVTMLCGKPVTSVDFTVVDTREIIGALLADGRLAVAVCNEQDDWESMIEDDSNDLDETGNTECMGIKPIFTNPCGHGQVQYRHFAWLDGSRVVLVGQSSQGSDSVFRFNIDISSGKAELENEVQLDSHVSMISSKHPGQVLLEFEDGSCKYYSLEGDLYQAPGFDGRCESISSYRQGSIGLHKTGKLFVNSVVVASDVTSFGIHAKSSGGPHLLYTSRSNFIRTIPLESVISSGISQVKPGDVSIRAIEEGCQIASCPSESVDVILQAPRGNLEIIRPRALVVPAVVEALDKNDYGKAWRLSSVNRLDLNILLDYRWPSLLENIEAFMQSIDSDVEVSGFLQSLSTHNVLGKSGIYSSVIGSNSFGEVSNKINAACEAVESYIQSLQEDAKRRSWMCTELTSHTKRGNIGKALLRVKEIKERDLDIINNHGLDHCPKMSAESGLKHILLHSPENDVYNAALQEYELELAYMVVTHSQRDPGEYLSQLQEFAVIENPCIRKASIDSHLGRYILALEHLHKAGSDYFPDALALAKDQGLLRHLLKLVTDQDKKTIVYKALGESLSTKGKYEDAALAYVAGKDLEQALRAYRLAGAWKPAMTLAVRLGKDENAIKDLATRLANDLDDAQSYQEAAQLTLEYLQLSLIHI